jgi:uncharacterized membrane protein
VNEPATGPNRALQAAWCLAGLVMIGWGWSLFDYGDAHPWVAVMEIATSAAGFTAIVVALTRRDGAPGTIVGWLLAVVSVLVLFAWAWVQIRSLPIYRTDEIAFDQYAAQLLAEGHNPYAHSMLPSIAQYQVPLAANSLTLGGTLVTSLSYPAMSFLVYVPFLLLGWSYQLAPILNVAAWGIAILVGYALVPRTVKPLMIVIGATGAFAGLTLSGVTDVLFIPLLMVALYRWDDWPRTRGWRRWIAPVAMGLATSVKQTPWLIVPFVLIGLALEVGAAREWRPGVRVAWSYLWRALVAFGLTNIAFIAIDPRAWVDGVLAPATANLIPQGQGWVALSTLLSIGGGDLRTFTVLEGAVLLFGLVVFAAGYPRTKALAAILPSIVFLFAARSQTNYLVMLIPPTIVAATTVRLDHSGRSWAETLWGSRRRRAAVGASGALVAFALLGTLMWPPPLKLTITRMWTRQPTTFINRMAIVASNGSGNEMTPVFFVKSGGQVTYPWLIVSGPARLPAGDTATYVIQAPNAAAEQRGATTFQVAATNVSPPSLSVSRTVTPLTLDLNMSPAAINRPIASGGTLTFATQLVDRYGSPVERAGVPISISVRAPLSRALGTGSVFINGSHAPNGRWLAVTDAEGMVKFSVTMVATRLTPFTISAHLYSAAYEVAYGFTVPVTVFVVPRRTTAAAARK